MPRLRKQYILKETMLFKLTFYIISIHLLVSIYSLKLSSHKLGGMLVAPVKYGNNNNSKTYTNIKNHPGTINTPNTPTEQRSPSNNSASTLPNILPQTSQTIHNNATLPNNLPKTSPTPTEKHNNIIFGNYTWKVRQSNTPGLPGPNYYSNSVKNVWIDDKSHLHMKIRKQDNKWYCTDLILNQSYGYGSYIFNIQKGFQKIDVRAVLGLFTYLDDSNQIDMELSQWEDKNNNLNTQYVVQPSSIKGNYLRFPMTDKNQSVIHSFTWTQKFILFQSFYADSIKSIQKQIGKISASDSIALQWKYRGASIPLPSKQRGIINFWLIGGKQPVSGLDQEIVVKQFEFQPLLK